MITTEPQDLVLLSLIPLSIKLPITDLNKKNYSILNTLVDLFTVPQSITPIYLWISQQAD